ncbi:F0F1 ATP synthase subunit A [soil metagenome]
MPLFEIPTQLINPFLAVSIEATPLHPGTGWLTNSILVAGVVLGLMYWAARKATRKMTLIPHRAQNAFEFVVEFLYGQVEGIVGKKFAPKAFPLLATIFLFILVSNWLGLVPGVGTVGWGEGAGFLTVSHVERPLLRPATADLNMTLGIALWFMVAWVVIVVRDVGVGGFLKHTFAGPSGLDAGILLRVFVGLVFLLVGVIEIVSIVFRPVSLSLRLFGNIYAGESLLHEMMVLGEGFGPVAGFITSVVFPLPFYFLEVLVGLLQAVVFALLCAVYIQLVTAHGADDHEHEHDEAAKAAKDGGAAAH